MIETAPFGDDSATIEKQISAHQKTHSSLQRNPEVDRARDDLVRPKTRRGFERNKMSHSRLSQLRELQNIIEDISRAIMWVNEREEEELVFDWGDKNIDNYIPKKQESYSRLMRDLEEKEKELNKLKVKADGLLTSNHPAADKIEAYMDTLQTQWSWLLQITKCIHVHLKENAAYSQFFKEANETYTKLQKEHETIRSKFTCDKNTPMENLVELLRNLEVKEKERIMENRRQVQSLVNKSKAIVRLKPRNPEDKSSSPVIVQALCDFKQDQKGILKGNEGILKDNSQRSKWLVTGPGGLDMLIPSVCLLIPPPNPLSIGLANKNEQYYEAIMGIWNQLYINIKSLISWQYCVKDINYINTLTLSMLSKMRPEEYRSIIKRLETHYQEFLRSSQGSEMFGEDDKKNIQGHFDKAQNYYDSLIIQLPTYSKDTDTFIIYFLRIDLKNCPFIQVKVWITLPVLPQERTSEYTIIRFNSFPSSRSNRLTALKGLLQSLLQAEDVIKVHEARLTEKETTSLDPNEIEHYRSTLKQMKSELDHKRDLLNSLESNLSTAIHWNSQVPDSFHKCDIDLSKYSDLVNQMIDRWRRIHGQIDNRIWDLEKHEKQVKHYQQTSTSLNQWIDNARKRQDNLQLVKLNDIQVLTDHLNQQKSLHTEIKMKKDKVEDLQKNADSCAASIKVSRCSSRPTANELQSHYIELLTRSGDYHRFLGEMLKTMEELKIRNTKIEMLEEEMRRLKDELNDRNLKNKNLEDELARLKMELGGYKDQLISMEEIKRTSVIQVNATRESLDSTQTQLQDLNDQLTRLKYQLEDEKRKRRLAEERYTSQQDEYETAVRKRQKELEELNWARIDLEKSVKDKERELERMKILLEEEAARRRTAETESSKTTILVHESQSKYTDMLREKDNLLAKIKLLEQEKNRNCRSEDELNRIKITLETELRNKQRLQDEKNNIVKELTYIKSQYELRDSQIKQLNTDRDRGDRERQSLKSQLEKLMLELRTVEERYKNRLVCSEKEVSELTLRREALEREIKRLQQRPNVLTRQTQTDDKGTNIDPSKLVFDGVRRKVTAHQLCDCGIISKHTLDLLLKGKKTVEEIAIDIQVNLKGTGIIAGITSGSHGKMPFTEAKNRNLLSRDSAILLLEAQAATGYMVDPTFNEKMPVDTACSRGIVDTDDRDTLLTAEAASTGFKDPYSGKLLSVGQACKQGRINKDLALRLLQAQEAVGGIIDPVLGVFLPKDVALDRNLIDEDMYRALNKKPACYIDPSSGAKISYSDLRKKCTVEPVSGLLLLRGPDKPLTVKGLRGEVTVDELIKSELLTDSDLQKLNAGKLTSKDIEDKLKKYLYGSTCIAGIYDEVHDRIMPFYQAMKEGLLMRGTTLELLEAQAASGFIVDPVNNLFLPVEEAAKRGLVGKEFKNKLLSAEKAVTGYTDPHTGKTISLFQAIEKELIEKGHGIRLLEAQIASGGIIDPKESHRIDVDVAYKRGYFDKEMNEILSYEGDDTKGFFDPNTQENLTYLQLKDRCITDAKTGLILLPLKDKKKIQKKETSRTNVLRKRRVVIVDPDTGLEMSVREAYHRELIDYDTFLDLSEQECEWEEITIKGSDGSNRLVIVDRKTGTQYDIQDCMERGVIEKSSLEDYRKGTLTLTQFADLITSRTSGTEMSIAASTVEDMVTCSSPTQLAPSSPTVRRRFNSISITVSPPTVFDDQSPVGAIFDTETLEKITIQEAFRRGIVDMITAQRLLEAQACTGGIINPASGDRLSLQEAVHQGIIDESMATKLKAAQKAYIGFEDVKSKRKMSAAEAVKETWLPYEAGQRFLEFQYLTGGLIEPGTGRRISVEEAIHRGWLDGQGAQKLQDTKNHQKNLTCPKTKLKISYKHAMDSCMVEESNGMKMLQASSVSTKGISSPYNVSNPGSRSGSRAGSRAGSQSGSRRGSVDYTAYSYSYASTTSSAFSNNSLS
uniref:Uncharacterized protein n=1 Tax=Periophthalmus magnuspinnatus TaxID=409849 RepID=A0A3B4AH70_9GOBI